MVDCTLDSTQEDRSLSYIDPAANAAPAPKPTAPTYTADDVLALVLQSLDDDKAEDVVQINLRGRSAMAGAESNTTAIPKPASSNTKSINQTTDMRRWKE